MNTKNNKLKHTVSEARQPPKLRKYLARVLHFRGATSFGESRMNGTVFGAPRITLSSVEEDDAVEEGVEEGEPPTAGTSPEGALSRQHSEEVNRVEKLSGVDIDGDGDIGKGSFEGAQRPKRLRVWSGSSWQVSWHYNSRRYSKLSA